METVADAGKVEIVEVEVGEVAPPPEHLDRSVQRCYSTWTNGWDVNRDEMYE